MKTFAIFTFADYVSISLLNQLIPELHRSGIHVILFEASKRFNKKLKTQAQTQLTFYEIDIPQLAARYAEKNPLPQALVKPLSILAKDYDFNIIHFDDANNPEVLDHLSRIESLAGSLSVRLGHVFGQKFIDCMKDRSAAAWNLHGGLLPDYKGLYIPYHAMANGESVYGWTLHELDYAIDTGFIIATCSAPLDYSKPVLDSYLDMVPYALPMITDAIDRITSGITIKKKPNQSTRNISYYSFPSAEMIRTFEGRGVRFTKSPMSYVQSIIDHFSIPGTPHAAGLQEQLINAIAEFERGRIDLASPDAAVAKDQAA